MYTSLLLLVLLVSFTDARQKGVPLAFSVRKDTGIWQAQTSVTIDGLALHLSAFGHSEKELFKDIHRVCRQAGRRNGIKFVPFTDEWVAIPDIKPITACDQWVILHFDEEEQIYRKVDGPFDSEWEVDGQIQAMLYYRFTEWNLRKLSLCNLSFAS